MMFGGRGNTDHDDCARIIHDAIDAGVNFVDTADVYTDGAYEEIVGKALEGRRDDVVLATKVHWEMGPGQNDHGNSRLWITREVENSLRRLRTDHIDLYQIHRPEPETDIEETLGVLTDLQRAGKIRYFGSSTFSGHRTANPGPAHGPPRRRGPAAGRRHPGRDRPARRAGHGGGRERPRVRAVVARAGPAAALTRISRRGGSPAGPRTRTAAARPATSVPIRRR